MCVQRKGNNDKIVRQKFLFVVGREIERINTDYSMCTAEHLLSRRWHNSNILFYSRCWSSGFLQPTKLYCRNQRQICAAPTRGH